MGLLTLSSYSKYSVCVALLSTLFTTHNPMHEMNINVKCKSKSRYHQPSCDIYGLLFVYQNEALNVKSNSRLLRLQMRKLDRVRLRMELLIGFETIRNIEQYSVSYVFFFNLCTDVF